MEVGWRSEKTCYGSQVRASLFLTSLFIEPAIAVERANDVSHESLSDPRPVNSIVGLNIRGSS